MLQTDKIQWHWRSLPSLLEPLRGPQGLCRLLKKKPVSSSVIFWQLPDTDAMMERKIQTALELNCSTSGALTHIGLID